MKQYTQISDLHRTNKSYWSAISFVCYWFPTPQLFHRHFNKLATPKLIDYYFDMDLKTALKNE